ncbi:MAG: MGMT family protein [Ignavibacteriae bacterium]|nr:MGMT family protein [Ignavibacteriota bacterium]
MKSQKNKSNDTYLRIWKTVEKIPRGKVATYGQIAKLSGFPGQARLVGYAMHNLPKGIPVPWHRVINAQGKISFPKETGNYKKQMSLLKSEGIHFSKERVDLNKFGWNGKKGINLIL